MMEAETELSKRLSRQHYERYWRSTATLAGLHYLYCCSRRCRRFVGCEGPMVESAYQESAMKARADLGLSPDAVAFLPVCIADQYPKDFARLQQQESWLRTVMRDNSQLLLPRFACMDPPQGKPVAGRKRRPKARHFKLILAMKGLIDLPGLTRQVIDAKLAENGDRAVSGEAPIASPCISAGPTDAAPPPASSLPHAYRR